MTTAPVTFGKLGDENGPVTFDKQDDNGPVTFDTVRMTTAPVTFDKLGG